VESSTNSCVPVPPITDPASIEQAVTNVAERSFFAFAETVAASTAADLIANGAPALTSEVRFSGPFCGEMRVTMPVALARDLAQQFSGDPSFEFSDADLADMAGEFANMVTGAWLTAADASSMFDLAAPEVTCVHTAPAVALMMQINGQPVGLHWHVE
jgi:CheY-specific phosphatase CheX